jgi:phage terminase small subunit
MALTDKQAKFVDEYLIDFNATQAAIRAGYAKNSAKQQGSRLLTNDDIRNEVARRGQQTADELGLTRGYVLTRLRETIERSLEGAPKTTARGELVFGPDGDHIIEWSPSGAKAALELLAKLRGDLVDTVEHTGGIDIRVEGVPVNDLK